MVEQKLVFVKEVILLVNLPVIFVGCFGGANCVVGHGEQNGVHQLDAQLGIHKLDS